MKNDLKSSFFLASISLFTLSCEKRSEVMQEVTPRTPESEQIAAENSDFDYRVIMIDGRIFLKPLFNDSEMFGPFVADGTNGDRFIYYPEGEGRPKEFRSAQQIYQVRETETWLFTDNYLSMAARKVDFPKQQKQEKAKKPRVSAGDNVDR